MSHELRTPLNAVIGYAELIRESAAEGDLAAIDADTAKIRRAAGRLVRTLTSILELSRLEADVVVPVRVDLDLTALVRDAVAQCELDAREHGDAVVLDLPPDLVLRSDPGMLAHCVHTLVDNAVRFTRRGRVDITLRRLPDLPTIEMAEMVELRVTDTGIGIAEADLARLFVSFQPLDDSTTRARDGSGVSLAVAQRFAVLLGGTITVSSAPARGSTFTLRLPAA
jgi:signal transduction histidine kinase